MLAFIQKKFFRKLIPLFLLPFLAPLIAAYLTKTVTAEFLSISISLLILFLSFLFFLLRPEAKKISELQRASEQVRQQTFDIHPTSPSTDELGEALQAFHDIADQLKMTMAAKEIAEESSRLRSEFLANMSHEIRTPLNGILGLTQVLAAEEHDPEKKSHLDTIDRCGRSLLHLINEILELSKLEAAKMTIHRESLELKPFLNETLATIEPLLQQKGLALQVSIDPQCPDVIETDRYKLSRILLNLLGNAEKFTSQGFVALHVIATNDPVKKLLFIVEDTGRGIPPDRLPFIFESFVQAQDYLSRSSEGTGLGLAIAKKLVELLGGSIWVESEVGKGTRFFVSLDQQATPNLP